MPRHCAATAAATAAAASGLLSAQPTCNASTDHLFASCGQNGPEPAGAFCQRFASWKKKKKALT
jgi:hypothetical protein